MTWSNLAPCVPHEPDTEYTRMKKWHIGLHWHNYLNQGPNLGP